MKVALIQTGDAWMSLVQTPDVLNSDLKAYVCEQKRLRRVQDSDRRMVAAEDLTECFLLTQVLLLQFVHMNGLVLHGAFKLR